MTTTEPRPDALHATYAEAAATSERRRDERWQSALKMLGVVLLLAAIAS
jgi:hypothetical protein